MKRTRGTPWIIAAFVVATTTLDVWQCSAYAEPTSTALSNEQLSALVLQLKQEVQEMRQTLQSQSQTIQVLQSQVEQQQGKEPAVAAAPPAPSELPKPTGLAETLHQYLLEAPASLPKSGERLPILSGMGKVDLGLLVQEWYTFDDHAHDNFRHRRLEMGLSGNLIDHLKWKVQIDPSLVREDNTTRSILKDAFVAFDGLPHHLLQLGQYKIPVTEEGFRSSAKIDTIERSFIGRTFGDKRDIGLMLSGTWKYADYQVGVFNGDGENRFDSNDQKDLAARFVLKPFPDTPLLKGLQVGSSLYGRVTNGTATEKKRVGAEARYENGPLALKAEYMQGQDAAVPANGWYVQAGYFILPRWQPIVRFEEFDPNERVSNDKEFDTTIGLNYFLVYPTTKLQLNYVHKDADSNGTTDNQIIGAAQYAF